jgi:hypothetical protein
MRWPDFRYDQQDLPLLCRAREVRQTEYHQANQVFGFDALLREYAGLPPGEPLPWTMEHAISFGDEPLQQDLASRLPVLLAVTEAQAGLIRPRVKARVLAVGSAFFYMRHVYRRRHPEVAEDAERRGTIVFPDKSTVNKDLDFDRERFAAELAALPAEFQPVAVSIFWKDFERGKHLAFERAGLTLVTSGHAFDPLFLLRQYDLSRQFKYACANDISTSFCLSVLAGCRFFYWPTGGLSIKRDGVTRRYAEEPTLLLPGKQACVAASPLPTASASDDGGAAQRELAEHFAGKESVRPPEFFQSLFAEGRRLLQSGAPRSVEFRHGRRLDELAGWLPRGLDANGWAGAECGLTIPPPSEADQTRAGVRVHFFVPRRTGTDAQTSFTAALDGAEEKSFALRPGCWMLELPAGRDGQPRRVTLRHDGGDPRRAFRIFQITWQPQAGEDAALRRLSAVRWARELRCRGLWVKASLRAQLALGPVGHVYKYVNARWFRELRP